MQTPTSGREHAMRGQHILDLIEHMGKPVIAAINGYALGGGCELAMACTIRIAADTAKLGQPEINLGLIPGYAGTQRLARIVGAGRALELLLTGDQITAQEAHRLGLVNRVVPAADLMAEAKKLAATLAAKAPVAVRYILEAVAQGRRDAVRAGAGLRSDALRPRGEHRGHARRHEGVPREAQSGVQGEVGVRGQDQPPAPLADASGFRFAVVVSRFNETVTGSLRDAALAGAERGGRRRHVQVLSVPGAFEIPQAARAAAETGPLRRGRLSRLRHPRRDAALRVHRVRGRARHHRRGRRHRRADGVRRADDRHGGAGGGAVGTGPRQQGTRGGGRGDRDGGALSSDARPATIAADRHVRIAAA